MSPLGDMLMKSLDLKPSAFGVAVSAYAFSASIRIANGRFCRQILTERIITVPYIGFLSDYFLRTRKKPYNKCWCRTTSLTDVFGVLSVPYPMALILIYLLCNNVVASWVQSRWDLGQPAARRRSPRERTRPDASSPRSLAGPGAGFEVSEATRRRSAHARISGDAGGGSGSGPCPSGCPRATPAARRGGCRRLRPRRG
ncbi:hypothetical protein FQR65_LT19554 [Abscondita terminalis]|nr:hypothetical protein FQR65_LT19554 [Abscondita terminalis]